VSGRPSKSPAATSTAPKLASITPLTRRGSRIRASPPLGRFGVVFPIFLIKQIRKL
jgi:hypothetical protein